MWTIEKTGEFKKDYRRAKKRGYDLGLLEAVIDELAAGGPLAERYCDHPLKGPHRGRRECHVAPDWVLMYRLNRSAGELWLVATGTHSDLQLE
jgi:mRNA interferase YafQ